MTLLAIVIGYLVLAVIFVSGAYYMFKIGMRLWEASQETHEKDNNTEE